MSGSTVEASIELYDTDRPAINRVVAALSEKVATRRPMEDFRQEVMGRFEEAGYETVVQVWEVYETDAEDEVVEDFGVPRVMYYKFAVDICGRVASQHGDGLFDHERMRHEVRQTEGVGNAPVVTGGFVRGAGTKPALAGAKERRTRSGIILPPKP